MLDTYNHKHSCLNLLNQKIIRVIINDGPRFGNQAVNFTLMQRLRDAGFKGKFHIVYTVEMDPLSGKEVKVIGMSVGEKIAHFVKGYDPKGDQKQSFEGFEIERKVTILQDAFTLNDFSYVPIAITAMDENSYGSCDNCKVYNCGAYISLKPLYWRGLNKIEFLNGDIEKFSLDLRFLENEEHAVNLNEIEDPKEKELLTLAVRAVNSGCDVQSIYGREVSLPLKIALERLIDAIMPDNFNADEHTLLFVHEKPVILDKIFDSSKLEIIDSVELALQKLQDPKLHEKSKGKVILVYTGPLSFKAFSFVQSISTLPPAVEGANSCEALERSAYLHCLSKPHENSILGIIEVEKFNIAPQYAILYNDACNSLSHCAGDVEALKIFMKKFKNGDFADYFVKRRQWFFNKEDVITCSVNAVFQGFINAKIPHPANGETALMIAIKENNLAAFEKLLINGSDFNESNAQGLTAHNYILAYDRKSIQEIINKHKELLKVRTIMPFQK